MNDASAFRMARVIERVDNGLQLQFEGEPEGSSKIYSCLQSCNAFTGERVLCAMMSGSCVVLGVVDRQPVISAGQLESNDDPEDRIRITYNPSKGHFYALSQKYTGWVQID